MRAASRTVRCAGKRVGFVPTMGALHEGHLSLVRAARAGCDVVAASIFVNPTQFGPNEDLAKYPRSFERDCESLEQEGVELVFAPSVEEMYPSREQNLHPSTTSAQAFSQKQREVGNPADRSVHATQARATQATTWVTVEELSRKLDGRSRPVHFRGVTTVVSKLFHIVEPDVAFFGQKDAAQVAVIKRMVRDLNFPVEIAVCPIVREPDGLAMSSRNAYLNPQERRQALVLHRSLMRVKELAAAGERNAARLIEAGRLEFAAGPSVRLDYFEIVDAESLDPVEEIGTGTLVAVAAYVGNTRLIDNEVL